MNMAQKGLGTGTIIAIVVAIVVVVVVAAGAVLLLGGGGPSAGVGGLPVYSGATETDAIGTMGTPTNFMETAIGNGTDIPSDVTVGAYTATGSIDDILNYYRTEMTNAGWTKKYDNTFEFSYLGYSLSIGLLYFEKNDRAAAVGAVSYAYQGENQLYFVLAEGPKSLFEGWMSEAGYGWEEGGEGEGGIIPSATSLDFKVDVTTGGETITYRERARNIGTSNMDLRVDATTAGTLTMSYIFSGSQHEGWYYVGGQWYSFSDFGLDFDQYWNQYHGDFETYTGYLGDWTSGEWSGTFGNITYRIYDIQVNPTIPDSVFQPG